MFFFLQEFCERPAFEEEISGENQYVAEEKGKIMFKVIGGKTSFLSLIGQERYTIKWVAHLKGKILGMKACSFQN